MALALGGVPGCKDSKPSPGSASASASLDPDTAEAIRCLPCHRAIVDEWNQAMHSQSTPARDPLYAFMVGKATAIVGDAAPAKCATCHAPSGLGNSPRERDGVSCLTCHELAGDHTAQTVSVRSEPAYARPISGNKDTTALCLSCHGEFKSPDGYEVCTTGAEHKEAARAGLAISCIDCHMPLVSDPAVAGSSDKQYRSHRFPAARGGLLAANTTEIFLSRDSDSGELMVTLSTLHIGHALPTGNPMRFVVASVTAMDADGKLLWKNHGDALPPFDAGEALFMRIFADAAGNRPVPPFAAAGAAIDQRLQPGQPRTLRYPMPSGTAKVSFELNYYLGPTKTLEAAGVPASWHKPIPLAQKTMAWGS